MSGCINESSNDMAIGSYCNVTVATGYIETNPWNFSNNEAIVNYTYIPDNYVRGATSRTLLR